MNSCIQNSIGLSDSWQNLSLSSYRQIEPLTSDSWLIILQQYPQKHKKNSFIWIHNFNHTFVISLLVPYLLFLTIKENFKKLKFSITLLLAIIVTLSPYFRTTAYWSLGENYAIIFLLSSVNSVISFSVM